MAFGAFKKGKIPRPAIPSPAMLRAGPTPIAIDFGRDALKMLQLNTSEPASLIAAACVPTPDELRDDDTKRFEFQSKEVARLVRKGGFKGKRAVCAIPSANTFCKHAQFPKVEEHELAAMVQSMLAAELHCDAVSLVHRYFPVHGAAASGGGRTEVVCMAASRGCVSRLMGAIKVAKLEPVGMHTEFVGLLRAFDYVTQRKEDAERATLYLDLGASGSRVVIAHGKDLVFARTIEIGGDAFDQAYAGHYGMSIEQARADRRRARASGEPAPAPVPAAVGGESTSDRRMGQSAPGLAPAPVDLDRADPALAEPIEILADEVALCVRYYESLFGARRLDGAVFVGGESSSSALCRPIARVLHVPAQIADPMARFARSGKEPVTGVSMDSAQPGWTLPVGLCLSPTDL